MELTGVEVDDCMMIEDDDMLFLSINDDFIAPADFISNDGDERGGEGEKIPHIIGGYKVTDLLGRGGFGEVRVGEHSLTGEKVALKFLRKSEILSLGAAERTNTEIQCLMALRHAHIIRLQHVRVSQHYTCQLVLQTNFVGCLAYGDTKSRCVGVRIDARGRLVTIFNQTQKSNRKGMFDGR